jgi:hypothetical protein
VKDLGVQYLGSSLYVRVNPLTLCLGTYGLRQCQTAVRTGCWFWVWRSTLILLSSLGLTNRVAFMHFVYGSHDSSVGIATRQGLNGPGIESRCRATFSVSDHTGPESFPASYTMATGFSQVAKRPQLVADFPSHLGMSLGIVWSFISVSLPSVPVWACHGVTFTFTFKYLLRLQKCSPSVTGNAVRICYRNKPANDVWWSNGCSFCESKKDRKMCFEKPELSSSNLRYRQLAFKQLSYFSALREFSPLKKSRTEVVPNRPFIQRVPCSPPPPPPTPRVKGLGSEVDRRRPFSADVKNVWSRTCTPPI